MLICFLICRYYPFICPTIAQNTFCVQLVVLSDFNRLQRKCECFVRCVGVCSDWVFLYACMGIK